MDITEQSEIHVVREKSGLADLKSRCRLLEVKHIPPNVQRCYSSVIQMNICCTNILMNSFTKGINFKKSTLYAENMLSKSLV